MAVAAGSEIALSAHLKDNEPSSASPKIPADPVDAELSAMEDGIIDIKNPRKKMLVDASTDKESSKLASTLRYLFGLMGKSQFEIATKRATCRVYVHRPQVRLLWLFMIGLAVLVFVNFNFGRFTAASATVLITVLIALMLITVSAFLIHRRDGSRSIFEIFNTTFGIPFPDYEDASVNNVDVLFDVDRRHWGLLFMLYTAVVVATKLVIMLIYRMSEADNEECLANEYSSALIRTKCVMYRSSIGQVYVACCGVTIIAASFYRVDPNCIAQMNQYFKDYSLAFQLTEPIQALRDRTQAKLRLQWKASKSWRKRSAQFVVLLVCAFVFQFYVYGVLQHDILNAQLNVEGVLFAYLSYASDAFMLACLVHVFVVEPMYHYLFPTYILKSLADQFDAEGVRDIIAWWQLREFYVKVIIETYGSGLTSYVGSSLVMAFVFAFFSYTWEINTDFDELIRVVFAVSALGILAFGLTYTYLAVNVYTGQLSHVFTVKREKLRLECLKRDADKMKIVDQILDDIKNNSKPFRVFGLPVVPQFFVFLQTSALSLFLSYVL